MISPTERPRDLIYDYVVDRLASLSARATIECREPTCGARDVETLELLSCNSKDCGENRMLPGWKRELRVMRAIKALIEVLEQNEMKKGGKR